MTWPMSMLQVTTTMVNSYDVTGDNAAVNGAGKCDNKGNNEDGREDKQAILLR